MSASNPLLKELKGYVLKLTLSSAGPDGVKTSEITDSNEYLQPLCTCLQKIFQSGLIPQRNSFGSVRTDAWYCFDFVGEKHSDLPYAYKTAWTSVKMSRRVRRHIGRLRLLIRCCLAAQCLHVPVEIIVRDQQYSRQFYHSATSILGDEMLGEVLLSAIQQCSRLPFRLDVKNALFLDETWLLPATAEHEFVPCRSLGFSIAFVQNVTVIVEIKPKSIAHENENIEIGDVLDEINGIFINTETQGKLSTIMKTAAKTLTPVVVRIVKTYNREDGRLYHPMIDILHQACLDPCKLETLHKEKILTPSIEATGNEKGKTLNEKNSVKKTTKDPASSIKPGFRVTYLGKIPAGTTGHVKQLEELMTALMAQQKLHVKESVFLECQELDVKVTSQSSSQVILKHSYMEISACGRVIPVPQYFAYIAGDDGSSCVAAETFSLYMFHCISEKEIDQVLMSIGQGFKRTHYAV